MKADIREISAAPTRAAAEAAIAVFVEKYGAKYPKAAECLTRDRDALLAFFDSPAEHWDHLRTTNVMDKNPWRAFVLVFFRAGDLVAKSGASAASFAGRLTRALPV